MVGPAPGSTPMRKPITVPRAMAQRLRAQSVAVSMTSRMPKRPWRMRMSAACSAPTRTSPSPKRPMATGRNSTPSSSSLKPKA